MLCVLINITFWRKIVDGACGSGCGGDNRGAQLKDEGWGREWAWGAKVVYIVVLKRVA